MVGGAGVNALSSLVVLCGIFLCVMFFWDYVCYYPFEIMLVIHLTVFVLRYVFVKVSNIFRNQALKLIVKILNLFRTSST